MRDHRRIYKKVFGPIPLDEEGRTYDIHHIDGNHSNNDPSNLKAVSIQEHYNIHYKQEDFGACNAISLRMKITPEERSAIARKHAIQQIKNGKNVFVGGELQRRLLKEGKHIFCKENNPVYKMLADRTHPWLNSEWQKKYVNKRVKDGTHNFLGGAMAKKNANIQMSEGRHPTQIKVPCEHCGFITTLPLYKRWHGDKCKYVR